MTSPTLLDPHAAAGGGYRAVVARAVRAVTRALAERAISPGEAADLRRLRAENLAAPAYWRVLSYYVAPQYERTLTEDEEYRWAVILNALAYLVGLDAANRPLGAALRDAGFSELRLVRLLRAEKDRLEDTVRNAARFLASKGQSANLAQLAELVLSEGRTSGGRVRRNIARDYFQPPKND